MSHTFTDVSPGNAPPASLPTVPTSDASLGVTVHDPRVAAGVVKSIESGPNTEYNYLLRQPVVVDVSGAVNTTALAVGSEFWRMQPETRRTGTDGRPYCGRGDVTAAIPGVWAHEGRSRADRYSHVQTYLEAMDSLVVRFESYVTRGGELDPMKELGALSAAAAQRSNAVTHDPRNNPFRSSCYFNYDPHRTYAR